MHGLQTRAFTRRRFVGTTAWLALTGMTHLRTQTTFGAESPDFQVGEGVVDTTPPLGVELAGFHRPPNNPRLITGIRQPTAARALVIACGRVRVALVALDILDVSYEFTVRVQKAVAETTGIPAECVHVCATHTHSMPAFQFSHQWGAVPAEYMADVERKVVQAVRLAVEDLAPAELVVGKSRAQGANFNRTTKVFKTDAEFTRDSTDEERWLDTMVHVLRFDRAKGKRPILWYHFSCHPVCFRDTLAGPDWPGLVYTALREREGLQPAYLQGHAGDVNPGDGKLWIGQAEPTAEAVTAAVREALAKAQSVKVQPLRLENLRFLMPLDMALFRQWLEAYRRDPKACQKGPWVDASFAAAWYQSASQQDLQQTHLPITLTAVRIGSLGMLLHPAELYSYYGLAIRRDSPLPDTLVVGYADGTIGYLPDPNAYKAGEYAAIVVPKILNYPPFTPTATREMTAAAVQLLAKLAAI